MVGQFVLFVAVRGGLMAVVLYPYVLLCAPLADWKTTNYPNLQRWQSVNFILKLIAIASGLKYLGLLNPLFFMGVLGIAFLIVIAS